MDLRAILKRVSRGGGNRERRPIRGADVEAVLMVTLEEAFRGARRRISLKKIDPVDGNEKVCAIDVKIPAGVRKGQKIRLSEQGQPSPSDGRAGDLYLRTRFAQHPYFTVKDGDLGYALNLAPWEAVLGGVVNVPTLHGRARVIVKAGSQAGQQLRLSGHGLPKGGSRRGDLLAEIRINMPKIVSKAERELWETLRDESEFDPRS